MTSYVLATPLRWVHASRTNPEQNTNIDKCCVYSTAPPRPAAAASLAVSIFALLAYNPHPNKVDGESAGTGSLRSPAPVSSQETPWPSRYACTYVATLSAKPATTNKRTAVGVVLRHFFEFPPPSHAVVHRPPGTARNRKRPVAEQRKITVTIARSAAAAAASSRAAGAPGCLAEQKTFYEELARTWTVRCGGVGG